MLKWLRSLFKDSKDHCSHKIREGQILIGGVEVMVGEHCCCGLINRYRVKNLSTNKITYRKTPTDKDYNE